MNLTLKRIALRNDGTFGVLLIENRPFCLTLERSWQNNQVGISCIPKGTYVCKRVQSPKFGDTFEVTGVKGRTHILFHKGNIDDDSHGCILIGEQFDSWTDGSVSIAASAAGFEEFKKLLKGQDTFLITIAEC